MKYSYEAVSTVRGEEFWVYRVEASGRPSLLAVCSVLENAEETVKAYRWADLTPHLAIALERLRNECPYGYTDARNAALAEAERVLGEWEQLTKTPPGTE